MILQSKRSSSHQIDMTSGPLFVNILRFMMPLILTNLLQQFYHAADIMIVGLSAEADAVGAVGSTGTFLTLINNLFIGFSVGANVVVARNIGKKDSDAVSRGAHTAICMSLLFGVLGAVVGIVTARPVLIGMGYTGNLLTLALRYSYIYLACLPFLSLTNFLASVLRAGGDTKTPLYVLTATGLLNICLNLFFVKVCLLSVEGVAIATAIANAVSSVVLWRCLAKNGGDAAISFRKLRISRDQFLEITRIGFPAGIQNALFSLSNILIQSSILQVNNALTPPNSAYAPVIKGSSATGSLENFIFTALAAATVAASTFAAQNMGAKNCRRGRRAFWQISLISVVIAIIMSAAGMLLRAPLLALYGVKDAEDVLASITFDTAVTRMIWKWPAFFIYAIMNACGGAIRGLGKSTTSAAITFFGTCVLRVVWVYTVFAHYQSLESIYISYPVSWLITGIFFLVVVFVLFRKKIREEDAEKERQSALSNDEAHLETVPK